MYNQLTLLIMNHGCNLIVFLFNIFQAQLSAVQSLSGVWLFVTPLPAACKASLSITNSQS